MGRRVCGGFCRVPVAHSENGDSSSALRLKGTITQSSGCEILEPPISLCNKERFFWSFHGPSLFFLSFQRKSFFFLTHTYIDKYRLHAISYYIGAVLLPLSQKDLFGGLVKVKLVRVPSNLYKK